MELLDRSRDTEPDGRDIVKRLGQPLVNGTAARLEEQITGDPRGALPTGQRPGWGLDAKRAQHPRCRLFSGHRCTVGHRGVGVGVRLRVDTRFMLRPSALVCVCGRCAARS